MSGCCVDGKTSKELLRTVVIDKTTGQVDTSRQKSMPFAYSGGRLGFALALSGPSVQG